MSLHLVIRVSAVLAVAASGGGAAAADFDRDVAPILQRKCAPCHGAVTQMGGVRFDDHAAALAGGYSGPVILPGKSAESRLIQMVTVGRAGRIMPPGGPKLTTAEVAVLREWIDAGAPWGKINTSAAAQPRSRHWAFLPVSRPVLPPVRSAAWARNPIDRFILAQLEQKGLAPSPEADRRTLIRRLHLDLTGLPPEPAAVESFLNDPRPDAYDRALDALLASPHYGEKWARHWLDLARYADSDGYEQDGIRPHAWRYRDWVIGALNSNMPFDRFTLEQIAGDLIPGASPAQRSATGFHRNTLTSREGGIDVEQLRDEQVTDRTNTVATVWLGLTVECARCHDHKYDPISQKEYYQLFAFFNSAEEVNLDAPVPGETGPYLTRLPDYHAKLTDLTRKYRVEELQPRWEDELRRAQANPEAKLEWTQALEYLRVYLDHGVEILNIPSGRRTWKQAHGIMRVFLKSPGPLGGEPDIQKLNFGEAFKALEELDSAYPGLSEIPAIREMPAPPETFIHLRGDFRSPGTGVQPGTPAVLPPLPGGHPDRMALAKWLVSPEHPLTARVAVNRIWQEYFGSGLAATSEDFGTRGERPSHPELLDWLAAELVASGWDVKHIHKLIATSATYRQSSKSRPELTEIDPANRLLARQSRLRLPAELVRDSALAVSGLLNRDVGGRSIRPPLPAGALGVAYRAKWEESQGPDRYRRGLYVFLQRSVPYPQLTQFDAPAGLVSCSRRERSTTPLQALTLLNDAVFVEAAGALAWRILREAPPELEARIEYGWRLCLGRAPDPEERDAMARYYRQERERLRSDPKRTALETPAAEIAGVPAVEAAAWVGTASVLLNLDEFITRE